MKELRSDPGASIGLLFLLGKGLSTLAPGIGNRSPESKAKPAFQKRFLLEEKYFKCLKCVFQQSVSILVKTLGSLRILERSCGTRHSERKGLSLVFKHKLRTESLMVLR